MASMDPPAARPVAARAADVAVARPTYTTGLPLVSMTTASADDIVNG